MNDPASLENLHDIVAPIPVPWWPPAPGWLFLGGLFLLVLLIVLTRAVLRYRRNTYRRAALTELQRVAAETEPLPLISGLLKRTALATYPREDVAGLTGEAWVEWLAETGKMTLPAPVVTALGQNLYDGGKTDSKALIDFTTRWIQRHRGGS
jgi:hypothetical protein